VKVVKVILEIRQAFVAPTVNQKEAYGRFAHTLAAAAIIGDVTIIFGDWIVVPLSAWRVVGLTFTGVICFFSGSMLATGE
jgi:hypothetical protein